jgi:hypothetical protein
MLLASVMMFYAEARMTQISLGIVFSATESIADPAQGGSFFDNLVSSGAGSTANPQPDLAQPQRITAVHRVREMVDRTIDSFEKLWDEPFGFMSMGLASLEGMFGVVILSGISSSQAARLRPADLFRQRPLVCTLFVLFNIALAAMAAMRGYELSPSGSSPWAPAIIAGLVSLALAPMLAFCVHFAAECAGDQFAMLELAVVVTAVAVGIAIVVVAWSIIVLAIFLILATVFLVYALPAAVLWVYFQCTKLLGDLMSTWKVAPSGFRHIAAQTLSILLGSIILLAGGYLLMKGHTL